MDYPPLAPGLDSETQAVIRGICRWHIAPVVEETFVLRGDGSSTILLPTLRLVSVTAVTIGDWVLTADELADLDWDPAGWIKLWWRRTPCRSRSVVVKVTHGYDACPGDILAAGTAIKAGVPFLGLKAAATLSNSFSTAAGGTDDGVDPYVAGILGKYRTTYGS